MRNNTPDNVLMKKNTIGELTQMDKGRKLATVTKYELGGSKTTDTKPRPQPNILPATTDWSKLLDKFNDDRLEEIPLAQAFAKDRAFIAIAMDTSDGREVILVDGLRKLHPVSEKVKLVEDLWLVRDDPGEYAQLVKPGWSKNGLSRFLEGVDKPEPQQVYKQLKEALGRLIDFSHDPIFADVACCWIIGTYFYRLFDAFPYLAVVGPKGSGKTKLASIVESVAFNPLRTDSVTTAQLFRSVHVTGGTLILDEQEALNSNFANDDKMSLLRSGYKQGGSALRSGDSSAGFKTEIFYTYGPKMLINTSGMEELLADRCVSIHMLRSTGPQGKTLGSDLAEAWVQIRDDLYYSVMERFPEIRAVYRNQGFAGGLNNRQRERWLPILSIASIFAPEEVEALEKLALKDTSNTLLANPVDAAFLAALDKLVDSPTVQLGTYAIRNALESRLEGESVSSAKVGRLVRKFLGDVKSRNGENGSTRYTVTRTQLDDLLQRYPITEGTEGTE